VENRKGEVKRRGEIKRGRALHRGEGGKEAEIRSDREQGSGEIAGHMERMTTNGRRWWGQGGEGDGWVQVDKKRGGGGSCAGEWLVGFGEREVEGGRIRNNGKEPMRAVGEKLGKKVGLVGEGGERVKELGGRGGGTIEREGGRGGGGATPGVSRGRTWSGRGVGE